MPGFQKHLVQLPRIYTYGLALPYAIFFIFDSETYCIRIFRNECFYTMIGYNKHSTLDGRYVNDSMHLRLTVTMTVPTDLADGCPFTIIDDGSHQRLPIKFMMCNCAISFLMKLGQSRQGLAGGIIRPGYFSNG